MEKDGDDQPAEDSVPKEIVLPSRPGTGYVVSDPDLTVSQGSYVVSIRQHTRVRRLHRVGSCHLRPGLDYTDFVQYGDVLPSASEYHHLCKRCFSTGAPTAASSATASSSSCSSGSSSDTADV